MTRTTRHFANSPRVFVLAILAWLLLVITPAYGMPVGKMGGTTHGGHATLSMKTGGHCHHTSTAKVDRSCCVSLDSCCAGHICGCATACGSFLAALAMRGIADANVVTIHWSQPDAAVPSSDFIPPLRPPAA